MLSSGWASVPPFCSNNSATTKKKKTTTTRLGWLVHGGSEEDDSTNEQLTPSLCFDGRGCLSSLVTEKRAKLLHLLHGPSKIGQFSLARLVQQPVLHHSANLARLFVLVVGLVGQNTLHLGDELFATEEVITHKHLD